MYAPDNKRGDPMNRFSVLMTVVAGCLAIGTTPSLAQNADAGQSVFKRDCAICHDITAGKNRIGPSLFGIVGRAAGTVPNFRYSDANKGSALTWDAATLDRYLIAPRTVVANTTMSYGGLKDEQKRRDLIAYLATVR